MGSGRSLAVFSAVRIGNAFVLSVPFRGQIPEAGRKMAGCGLGVIDSELKETADEAEKHSLPLLIRCRYREGIALPIRVIRVIRGFPPPRRDTARCFFWPDSGSWQEHGPDAVPSGGKSAGFGTQVATMKSGLQVCHIGCGPVTKGQ